MPQPKAKITSAERMAACQSHMARVLNSNTNPAFVPTRKGFPNQSEATARFPYRAPFDYERNGGVNMMQHRKQAR